MSENETIVVERHTTSGHTLKPIFLYSREEYFDTPQPSQKSHQVSTLSVPRESPNIVSMPKNLPSYVMAGEYSLPNAQLVRRRIDYQETAEYRVVGPVTRSSALVTPNTVDGRGDASTDLRIPLSIRVDEQDFTDEKLSTGSSMSSSGTRRKTRACVAEPTDRVLRSQNKKEMSTLQRNTNYGPTQETVVEEEEVTSTPLASRDRRAAIRRRVDEIEAEEHVAYPHSFDVQGIRHEPMPLSSAVLRQTRISTSRPWHLSSMLGLSEEPTYRSPSLQSQAIRRRHSSLTSRASTFSFIHFISGLPISVGAYLYTCLLNLIVIPLVLLHYLTVAFSTTGKALATVLSGFYHRITTILSTGNRTSRTHSSVTYSRKPNISYFSKHPGYRGPRSSLCYGGVCMGWCCYPLLILTLLLLGALIGFLFRPSGPNPEFDEHSFLFGLLPSDAQCFRMARASLYTYAYDEGLSKLRWNCLSWTLLKPSTLTLKDWISALLNWFKSLRILPHFLSTSPSSPASTSVDDSFQPLPNIEAVDSLLERLQIIDSRMGNLSRQVKELRKAFQDRSTAGNKEYAAISADVSQLQTAVTSLKEQISLVAESMNGRNKFPETDDQYRQRLIDDIIKHATYVSTATLDARLQDLRTQLELMINEDRGRSTAQQITEQQLHRIEVFGKTLGELSALLSSQKSDLEAKLKVLREEFVTYKKDKSNALEALNAKIAGDIVSAAAESRSDLDSVEKRLAGEVEKISARIGSLERLNKDLENALKKLTTELDSLRETEMSERSASSNRLEELIKEMKDSFAEKVTLDLKQSIFHELVHTTDSGSILKEKLLHLIRSTVDTRLKETFATEEQSITEGIPAVVLAHIDSMFEMFAADGTGKADFALESAGGTVVSTRCTRTYTNFKSAISLFGVTLAYWSRSPNEILQPGTHPGECWCFHGSEGQAIVRLSMPVYVTGVSLEHIPKSLAPTGRIDSAPREFFIRALESEWASPEEGEVLGTFMYDESGKPIQYFPVKARTDGKPTLFVELAITSNHGHPNYTCIYRLRVHGQMAELEPK